MGNCANQCSDPQELYIGTTPDHPERDLKDSLTRRKIQIHIPNEKSLVQELPDYSTPASKETMDNLAEFDYDGQLQYIDEDSLDELPYCGPVEIDTGIYYIGQFKNKKRHGRGRQIYQDGSQYEGFWK